MPKKKSLLTKEQMEAYNGSKCPRCGSKDIEVGGCDFPDLKTMVQDAQCRGGCELKWKEHYTLTGILEGSVEED